MIPMSRYALMGGTVATAVGIGFFMQSGPSREAYHAPEGSVQVASASPAGYQPAPAQDQAPGLSDPQEVVEVAPPGRPLSDALDENATSIDASASEPLQIAAVEAEPEAPSAETAPALTEVQAACDPVMEARVEPAAMVTISLTSCQPDQRVTLHHNGMMVQAMTDAEGKLELMLPALSEQALYIAEFPNRDGAVAQAEVTSLPEYERLVLQWRGDAALSLSAQEFGAAWGGDGHIRADAPGSVENAVTGVGGFLTKVGDFTLENSLRAEVYTFPRNVQRSEGGVEFTVDAEVTAGNCDKEIGAQSIQLGEGGMLTVRELVLPVPYCSGIGDYIVLKNMAEDLKVALN